MRTHIHRRRAGSLTILAATASALALAPTAAHADPGRVQPDNWGQCVNWILDLGFNPSIGILPPGRFPEGSFGPAVVFWKDGVVGGEVIAVHYPQGGFSFGQACNYFDVEDVDDVFLDDDGTYFVALL